MVDILDNFSVPSVDCLYAPTLDPTILNQISQPQTKKFVQDCDKEKALVQRAFLNTTGPLCSLHDALSSGQEVPLGDIKSIIEQTICLLGSANHQLSVLRRKKVLAKVNKNKIGLADQCLPNVKRSLFGDDFPSIASKEADLSSRLAKNLAHTSVKACHPSHMSTQGDRHNYKPGSNQYSQYPFRRPNQFAFKYQNNRPKNSWPFRPKKVPQTKDQQLPRKIEASDFRPRNFECCVML